MLVVRITEPVSVSRWLILDKLYELLVGTNETVRYTAISRKALGKKCARDNPERQYGI